MDKEKPVQIEVSRSEMLALIHHFKGKPVNNTVLLEYCNLHHISHVSEGAFQDWSFQLAHDERMDGFIPEALQILARYKPVPELMEHADRMKLIDENEKMESEICGLMEKHGILYQEIDLVMDGLLEVFKRTLTSAKVRVNNTSATMLAYVAKEKYGDPLTVKALGEAYREVGLAKGKAQGLE